MKRIIYFKEFDNRINESLINVNDDLDFEIEELERRMCEHDECGRVDNGYIEIVTPFELNPDSNNSEWVNKVGMVFYPELLSYADQTTPWIACRTELEGEHEESLVRDLLKYLIGLLQNAGYNPFMDEDAFCNHWKKDERSGFTKYVCYVNTSYPDGYWENHCLE
jgi:hypothetical protein